MLSSYGWIINPIGILTIVLGLSFYFSERNQEGAKKIIGKKWGWFILLFIIDTLLYITCAVLMVVLTGGV